MKPSRMHICLVVISITGFLNNPLLASSPSKKMAKVHFEQYTGAQRDWPRSAGVVAFAQTNHGMPIYDKLPSRPYEVLGVMSDDGDHAVKHVAEAAQVLGADAVLVVGDKAFTEAGLNASPRLLENAEVPDPNNPAKISRLEHGESLKAGSQQPTIRVTEIVGILIRWTAK